MILAAGRNLRVVLTTARTYGLSAPKISSSRCSTPGCRFGTSVIPTTRDALAISFRHPSKQTISTCGTYQGNTSYCRNAIFSNLGEVDDRGYIYNLDRAGSGMTVLKLTGDAWKVVTASPITSPPMQPVPDAAAAKRRVGSHLLTEPVPSSFRKLGRVPPVAATRHNVRRAVIGCRTLGKLNEPAVRKAMAAKWALPAMAFTLVLDRGVVRLLCECHG